MPFSHQRLETLTVKPGSPDGEPVELAWSYAEDEVLEVPPRRLANHLSVLADALFLPNGAGQRQLPAVAWAGSRLTSRWSSKRCSNSTSIAGALPA
jgi:hypothetical protein